MEKLILTVFLACVPKPNKNSIIKNMIDHTGLHGNKANA
jgi:hypothetical protein